MGLIGAHPLVFGAACFVAGVAAAGFVRAWWHKQWANL